MFGEVKELMKDILGLVLEICRLYFFVVIVLVLYGGIGLFDIIVFDATYTDEEIHFFVLLLVGAFIFNTIGIVISNWIDKNREANLTVEELEKIYVVVEDGSEFKDGYVQAAKKIINSKHGENEKIVFPMDEEVVVWCYNKLNKTVVFGYYFIEKNGVLERHEYVDNTIKGDTYEFTIDGEIIYQDLELYKLHYKQVLLKRGIEYKE